MSYAASLLATYPSSYGPSTLLSDDLVQRSTFDTLYPSTVPYMSSGRLLSDDLAFNQMNYDTKTTYRTKLYPHANNTSVYSAATYQQPMSTNQRPTLPPNHSFTSLNDISEYSDSLATASNTNTASSVARSVNENNYNFNRMPINFDDNQQNQSVWDIPPTKQKGQTEKINPKITPRTQQSTGMQKTIFTDDDRTPIQSPQPKQQNYHHHHHQQQQHNTNPNETRKHSPSVNVQAWVNDTKKALPVDDKAAEETWSMKIDQLHHAQAQRAKEKAKSSRALPIQTKKTDNKTTTTKTKTNTDPKSGESPYQNSHDSYFGSLFDGDFFRKPATTDHPSNSNHPHQTTVKKNKLTTTSFNNPPKNSKPVQQRKTQKYEPPTTTKRAPPPPPPPPQFPPNTWKKPGVTDNYFDSMYPHYSQNEPTHRDMNTRDTDERFKEALQKLRQDRAEQQQKDINEKTAKRLNYGDYVRHLTKDALLQNAVKPSPWSDFMDLKKGNLYSLSKEEKKELYNQSKLYGEKVRYRNLAIHNGDETTRSQRYSLPLIEDIQDSKSDTVTPHPNRSKSVSRTSKRADSASTNRSHTKATDVRPGANQTNRSNIRNHRQSDTENETQSDHETNRKTKQQAKKKNVRYAKYDSSGRTTNGTDDHENELENHQQQNPRMKNRDMNNNDLFTVREEKTIESIEAARYKKR